MLKLSQFRAVLHTTEIAAHGLLVRWNVGAASSHVLAMDVTDCLFEAGANHPSLAFISFSLRTGSTFRSRIRTRHKDASSPGKTPGQRH
jgi:hypothetical protein